MAYNNPVVDKDSISYQQILEDLRSYIDSLPESERWQDFFDSGAGTTLTQLMSGIGSMLAFHSVTARREATHPETATLRSSIYYLADTLGYPVNRRTTAEFNIGLQVNSRQEVERTTIFGYFNGTPISLPSSRILNTGEVNITGILSGEWKHQSHTSNETINFADVVFDVGTDVVNVDNENFEVYVNNQQIPTTKFREELDSDNVLVRTLPSQIMLTFGDGFFGRKLRNNDVVEIYYIEVEDPLGGSNVSVTLDNLELNVSDVSATSIELRRPAYSADSLRKIAKLSPGYFSTKRMMISDDDHEYLTMSYPGIVSAAVNRGWCSEDKETLLTRRECVDAGGTWIEPYTCCTTEIAYLFDDEHIMSDDERHDLLLDHLEDRRISGENILFVAPTVIDVNVEISLVTTEDASASSIEDKVRSLIEEMTFKLGGEFRIGWLVSQISQIDNVIRPYIHKPSADRRLTFNRYFRLNDLSINFYTSSLVDLEFAATSEDGYVEP